MVEERQKSSSLLPGNIWVVERKPTTTEYRDIGYSIGWSSMDETTAEKRLTAALFAVVAEDSVSSTAVGCALLLGDHTSYYYVKDVMVRKDWQGKRVGTALMQGLTNWLDKNAANNSLVSLISRETLEPFYQQFGFAPAFSIVRHIHRNEKDKG
jgi:GNAT superfamily N-acetyltransferase